MNIKAKLTEAPAESLNKISKNITKNHTAQIKHIDPEEILEAGEAIANQNRAFINNLQSFNIESLDDFSLDETFDLDELKPLCKGVNISPVLELCYSYITEQLRHIEKTGKLIPYKEQEVIQTAKSMGLNEKETIELLEKTKNEFLDRINILKKQAIDSINQLSPTKAPHNVYRVITNSSAPESRQYFNSINALKKGDSVVLSTTPIYVCTSGKKAMGNYGRANNATLFKINLPQGSKLLKFPSTDGIDQCIMKPGAKFLVTDNKPYKNNFHQIELDYLLDD